MVVIPKSSVRGRVKQAGSLEVIGRWAFILGTALAIASAFAGRWFEVDLVLSALFVLGVAVGVLNITAQETTEFLVASLVLMLAGAVNFGFIPGIGVYVRAVLGNIAAFVVPAAVIVALRAVWMLAKQR